MKKTLLASLCIILLNTAFAGISTKKQDILKLIGTSFTFNGKFAWIELNGEDYGLKKLLDQSPVIPAGFGEFV